MALLLNYRLMLQLMMRKNVLIGATQYMEYSMNGKNRWADYDPKNPPKFEGNQQVFVRHKGEMNLEDGLSKKVTFKK